MHAELLCCWLLAVFHVFHSLDDFNFFRLMTTFCKHEMTTHLVWSVCHCVATLTCGIPWHSGKTDRNCTSYLHTTRYQRFCLHRKHRPWKHRAYHVLQCTAAECGEEEAVCVSARMSGKGGLGQWQCSCTPTDAYITVTAATAAVAADVPAKLSWVMTRTVN